MKAIYKTATMALCVMTMLAGCGNAGAKNDSRKKSESKEKAVKELTSAEFKAKVYDVTSDDLVYLGDKPAIVDFTASWCGPCQRIAPILEELAVEYEGKIYIYKVDIDKERALAEAFNVTSVPALLFIPGGSAEPVMTIGARGKEKFKQEIQTLLLD